MSIFDRAIMAEMGQLDFLDSTFRANSVEPTPATSHTAPAPAPSLPRSAIRKMEVATSVSGRSAA
jgi:hypothetical protein